MTEDNIQASSTFPHSEHPASDHVDRGERDPLTMAEAEQKQNENIMVPGGHVSRLFYLIQNPEVGQHSQISGFHISRLIQLGLKQVRARLKALICCYPAIFSLVRVASLFYRY